MSDWQTGQPDAPGLYLTVEPYGEHVDIGLRPFGENHQWGGGGGRPQPLLWMAIPPPPGYQALQGDAFVLTREATT